MILPCLCYKRLSHDLSPSSEVLCAVDGKKKARWGRREGELLFLSSTTRSLKPRPSLWGGESATASFLGFEFHRLLPIRKEKGNATPLKTIFNIVEQSESDKVI